MSFNGIIIFLVSTALSVKITSKIKNFNSSVKIYHGSCHCKSVSFVLRGPKHLVVWKCDCSICLMKQNHHVIIPERDFTLIQGQDTLREYKFNTGVARHLFCGTCGVQSFYRPRSNPDGYAVTLACIDKEEIESFEYVEFQGKSWETVITHSGIQKFSK